MRVALYMRRSTVDLQPDSLEAQEELLRGYAAAHDHEVVRVFRDSASGRSVKRRDQFQCLIEDVRAGASFSAILVRDVSRWSRAENIDEAGYYEFVCRSHGVEVLYVDENFGQDQSPYGILMKSVKRAMAAEFCSEKSRMVHSSALRLARLGFWPTGSSPYAMTRVLVDSQGVAIQLLAPGERKALSTHRIKLAPGAPDRVAVVQRVFHSYVEGGRSLLDIAASLNAEGVASSKGSVWTVGTLAHMLRNEVYCGTIKYRLRGGRVGADLYNARGSEEEVVARCPAAHEAIVSIELWNAAQARLLENSHRRCDTDLLGELRAARCRWFGAGASAETVTAAELRGGYGNRQDQDIIGEALAPAIEVLLQLLQSRFHVTPQKDGWLLDHLLSVGYGISLPHARSSGLHWDFSFSEPAQEDVLLGLGFSPPPVVQHVATFLFGGVRFHRGAGHERPLLACGSGAAGRSRLNNAEDLLDALTRSFRLRGAKGERMFLDAVRGMTKVNLGRIAEQLHWSVDATRQMYRRLEARGVGVPPLKGGTPPRRVSVLCPHCHRTRFLAAKVLLTLDTDVCFECLHRPPLRSANTHVATCPDCGARRLLGRAQHGARPEDLVIRCRPCAVKTLNQAGIAAKRARGQQGQK